jgi:hypothetical protein
MPQRLADATNGLSINAGMGKTYHAIEIRGRGVVDFHRLSLG